MKRVFEVYAVNSEIAEGEATPYIFLTPHDHEIFVDENQEDGQREFCNQVEVIQAVQDFNRAVSNPESKHFGKSKLSSEIVILETLSF